MNENRILHQVRIGTFILAAIAIFFAFQRAIQLTIGGIPTLAINIEPFSTLFSAIVVTITIFYTYSLFLEQRKKQENLKSSINTYFENKIERSDEITSRPRQPDLVINIGDEKYLIEIKIDDTMNKELFEELSKEVEKGNINLTKVNKDE